VTVIDTENPVIECPDDVTIQCDESVNPNANEELGFATATDNCDQNVAVTYSDVYGEGEECPQNYTITRTWKVTDDAGNMSTWAQLIHVEDTTAPQMACPASITVAADRGGAWPAM
jgi:hypothetical protein